MLSLIPVSSPAVELFEGSWILNYYSPEYGIVNKFTLFPVDNWLPRLFYGAANMHNISLFTSLPVNYRVGGAGLTEFDAIASSIGEAIERYSGSVVPYDRLCFDSFLGLRERNLPAVAPEKFGGLFTEEQYLSPGFVCKPFTEKSMINWVKGESLVTGSEVYVPASFVYIPYLHQSGEDVIFPQITTGMAFGLAREQALLSGLFEVIERDCFTRFWMQKRKPRKINLRGMHNQSIDRILDDAFSGLEDRLSVYELRSDLEVPTFFATLENAESELPAIAVGASSNVDPVRALSKAMIEVSQTMYFADFLKKENREKGLRKFSGDPDRDFKSFDDGVLFYSYPENIEIFDFMKTDCPLCDFDPSIYRDYSGYSVAEILKSVVSFLGGKGFEPVAVNITPSDITVGGGEVWRVLVPGLVPLHGSYRYRVLANKRLVKTDDYDRSALEIKDLNAAQHPFP